MTDGICIVNVSEDRDTGVRNVLGIGEGPV